MQKDQGYQDAWKRNIYKNIMRFFLRNIIDEDVSMCLSFKIRNVNQGFIFVFMFKDLILHSERVLCRYLMRTDLSRTDLTPL